MDKTPYVPKKIYINRNSEHLPMAQRILENAGNIPVEFIEDPKDLIDDVLISRDPVGEGKKILLVTNQKGEYVKPCPCTPAYIGCNYFIINSELNCPLDCSYCILQLYLNNPLITVHANTGDLWRELDVFLGRNQTRRIRIGTGELGDSLALDHLTNRSTELISRFASYPNACLELKTKSVNIDNILKLTPPQNVVIAWSLNTRKIARQEEQSAPSVRDRIRAARLVSQSGYRVGFHFDPIIHYKGWEDGYAEIIEDLMAHVAPEKIAWISLGSLRFPPALKPIIQKRFPETKIIYEEFIIGKDGKARYPKQLRKRLFGYVFDRLRKAGAKSVPVYFCMESKDVWSEVQKKTPRDKEDVEEFLALSLGVRSP